MLSNFPTSLALILKSEGGFVNHPRDPGGMTNLGVTRNVWKEWVKHDVDEAEMHSLTPELVAPLYKARYWDACRCSDVLGVFGVCVFDSAVNMGPFRAAKLLQTALGVTADGVIGRATIAAATAADPAELLDSFNQGKEEFYKSLATFSTFGRGWLNRVAHVRQNAEKMTEA